MEAVVDFPALAQAVERVAPRPEQPKGGRPAPSYARSDSAGVVVVIPGGEANLDFVRLLVTEAQGGRTLGLDELLNLSAATYRALYLRGACIPGQGPRPHGRGRRGFECCVAHGRQIAP